MESPKEFYQCKCDWMPENIQNDIGLFNVFSLEPYVGKNPQPVPYKRRDFYKIKILFGQARVYYADRVVEVQKNALSFSNPQIPYKWEHIGGVQNGFFCIFNADFFHRFGNILQYEVFQPQGIHIFELSDEQTAKVKEIYQRMFEEINSEYVYKYDVLRNLVLELIHLAMKTQPRPSFEKQPINAAQRISALFIELLERQFPIDDTHPRVNLRSASDFAGQLNVHVNHLNRAIKESMQKTTSQVIAERFMQEAKILLKYSNWQVAEIADALGFKEVTHFNNFFKKNTQLTPIKFRKS